MKVTFRGKVHSFCRYSVASRDIPSSYNTLLNRVAFQVAQEGCYNDGRLKRVLLVRSSSDFCANNLFIYRDTSIKLFVLQKNEQPESTSRLCVRNEWDLCCPGFVPQVVLAKSIFTYTETFMCALYMLVASTSVN